MTLCVGLQAKPRLPEGAAQANAGEHVLQRLTRAVVVEDVAHGDKGHLELVSEVDHLAESGFLTGQQVAGDPEVELLAEEASGLADDRCPVRRAVVFRGPDRARIKEYGDKPLGVLLELVDPDPALALGRAASASGQKGAEVSIALSIPGDQDEGWETLGGDTSADEEVQSDLTLVPLHTQPLELLDPGMGPDHAIDAIAIGEGEPSKPEGDRLINELLGVRGSVEKGEVRAAHKLGIVPEGAWGGRR